MSDSGTVDKTPMERVLVVDDERNSRYALVDALASKGFDPDTAEDGSAALARVQRDPSLYGLVYSDIQTPKLSGLALVEQLAGVNPTIVTVVTTDRTDTNDAPAAMRAGAFDVLHKPFTTPELEISLMRMMERAEF
jgi:DNA-binding NtrC family response regulator